MKFSKIIFALITIAIFPLTGCEQPANLTINKVGKAFIDSDDGSISCGSVCDAQYDTEKTVTLTANELGHFKFLRWDGCDDIIDAQCRINIKTDSEKREATAYHNPTIVVLQDLTFEAPEHVVGEAPGSGFSKSLVQEFFGWPINQPVLRIEKKFENSDEQALLFQPEISRAGFLSGKELTIPLKHKAEKYIVEFDVVVESLNINFVINFNWIDSKDQVVIFAPNGISYNGPDYPTTSYPLGNYTQGKEFHLSATFDMLTKSVDISIDDRVTSNLPLTSSNDDLNSFRFFALGETSDKILIDNLIVKAVFNEQKVKLKIHDIETIIDLDFDNPPLSSSYGEESHQYNPYQKSGFNFSWIIRRDPAKKAFDIPSNGTLHAAITGNNNPIIYHQLGYPFQLVSMDLARYNMDSLTYDVEIIARKRSGEILKKILPIEQIEASFKVFEFDSDWKNLDYVMFSGDGFSVDNIKLEINDTTISFEAD